MPDGRRRSREHWTDTMEAGPSDPPAHVHRLPRFVRLAVVGLVAAVFLLAVALGLMAVQVYKANQYVQGRGEFRDREAARMEAKWEERNRELACDMADQFPEGGWLDRLREKYDCGPGIPIADLTPDEQQQLSGRGRAEVAPLPPVVEQPPPPQMGGGATSNPPRRPSSEPPAVTDPGSSPQVVEPAPESTPAPLVDLEPTTETVCGLLRACG